MTRTALAAAGRAALMWPVLAIAAVAAAQVPTPVGQEAPRYPVERLRFGCVGRPCGPFRLLDLDVESAREGDDRGAVRFALAERVVIGLSAETDRRGAELRTAHVRLRVLEADDGSLETAGSWQGRRWSLSAAGARRADDADGGWSVAGGVGFRPSTSLRLRADLVRDLDARAPDTFAPRPWTSGRIGAVWQPGPGLELAGGVGYARLRSGLDERLDSWSADVGAVWQAGAVRTELAARLDDERGRFDRRDVAARLRVDVLARPRLLLSAGLAEEVELGVTERGRTYEAAVTLFGRRYRFPRGGAIGPALEGLVERAWEEGFGVDRAYDVDGLRDLRERLTLSGVPGLSATLDALHRAQIDDRAVPQLGVAWIGERRPDLGREVDEIRALLGIPWPVSGPWTQGEARVELLRLGFRYHDVRHGPDLREIGRGVEVEAWLHRELAVRVDWRQRVRSPLELVLAAPADDRLTAGLRYVYGR